MVGLLQNMIFPEVKGDPLIDDIIHKCWHNKYHKVADLAERTEALLVKESSAAKDTGAGCRSEWRPFSGYSINRALKLTANIPGRTLPCQI